MKVARDRFVSALQIQRREIFGENDEQLPIAEQKDALVPQIGFIGGGYSAAGDVLLGINPGGGGDTYKRTPEDAALLPMIQEFRHGHKPAEELNFVFDLYMANMRSWNLWRIVSPTLEACGRGQQEIAYLNWCPFRTRNDKMPKAAVMRRSWEAYLLPLLQTLKPARVVALGKKAGIWLEKESLQGAQTFVVPRTIGDSYVSDNARKVLESIRKKTK